ncbi:MAG: septum site-determining protein MinC [Actinomycetia bacterium]|nr:septum site-determining protein MinC [Actinomycetes bacterium]
MDIKGDRRGLRVLAVGFADEAALVEDLERTLAQKAPFLGAAPLTVEVDRPLTPTLLAAVGEVFRRHPPLSLAGIQQGSVARPRPLGATAERAPRVVRGSLRSGQDVQGSGDVVVVGDVNPGARVVAGGDVFVLGRLRGEVAAGQPSRRTALIWALDFQPTQVRIGDIRAIPDGQAAGVPEVAAVDGDRIVVTRWTSRLPAAGPAPGVNVPERAAWPRRASSGSRS